MPTTRKSPTQASRYPRFEEIDGSHPFKAALPAGHVDYAARRRHDGEVAYFNFDLARELGLVPDDHPDQLNRELRQVILDTFCLVIVNEFDRLHPERVPNEDILPHTYMATRYLQLQHPDKRGLTSGDGRSVWNGHIRHRGVTWDVSSCGTGVTCLCPATGEQRRFFETGSSTADYGCGTATLEEGIGAALTSEIFHANGIETERVLAVIATPHGQAINVRVGRNLIRPAHMFLYLRQHDRSSLAAAVDLFIDRQVANGDWPSDLAPRDSAAERRARYGFFADEMARTFARLSATFESEYIFCWMDWDGDNILANGGIIDYGSVRQFGLYHRDYRFDDGPRWSTSIPEQKRKARHIVHSFVQIREFLTTGRRPPRAALKRDPALALFDSEFDLIRQRLLLRSIGYPAAIAERLREDDSALLERFRRCHAYFERAQSSLGPHRSADGLSHDAIFSTRDLLRELPRLYRDELGPVSSDAFFALCTTDYAQENDRGITPYRHRMARAFQHSYAALVEAAARGSGRSVTSILGELASRSAIINRFDRVTGDALTHATTELVRNRGRFSESTLRRILHHYVALQSLDPEASPKTMSSRTPPRARSAKTVLDTLIDLQDAFRHGL